MWLSGSNTTDTRMLKPSPCAGYDLEVLIGLVCLCVCVLIACARVGWECASIMLFKVKELLALGHTLFQETLLVCDSLEMILFASCSDDRKA